MIIEYDTMAEEFIISSGTLDDYLTQNINAIKGRCVIHPYRVLIGISDTMMDAYLIIKDSFGESKNVKIEGMM